MSGEFIRPADGVVIWQSGAGIGNEEYLVQPEIPKQKPEGFSIKAITEAVPADAPKVSTPTTISSEELASRYGRSEAPSIPTTSAIDPNSQDPHMQGLRRWVAEAPWKHEPRPSGQ